MTEPARRLLGTTLTGLGAGDEVTLQVHPPGEVYPALLHLHVRGPHQDHAGLRRSAEECGAAVSDLGDDELLVRLQPKPKSAVAGGIPR